MFPFFEREADALQKDGIIFLRLRNNWNTSKREMTALFELVPTWLKNTVFVKERSLDFPLKQLGS